MARLYLKGPTVSIFDCRFLICDLRLRIVDQRSKVACLLVLALFYSLFVSYSYCDIPTDRIRSVEVEPSTGVLRYAPTPGSAEASTSSVNASPVQETNSTSSLNAGSPVFNDPSVREPTSSMRSRPSIIETIRPVYLPKTTRLEIVSDIPLKMKQVKLSKGGILRIEIFDATTSLPDTISIDKGILRGIAFETEEGELRIYVSLTEPVIYEVESTDRGLVVVFQNPLLEQLVSLNVDDESLSTVLLMLFMQYGANIVAGSGVSGKVTAHLVDVPLRVALDKILEAEGYGYVEENGLIRVLTAEELEERKVAEVTPPTVSVAPTKAESKIFQLKFADVKEMQQILQGLVETEGTILADQRTNSLIVVSSPEQIERIEEIISQLDTEVPEEKVARTPEEVAAIAEEEAAKRIVKRVFKLSYVSPEKASAILQPFLSEAGTIQVIEEEKDTTGAGRAGGGRGAGMGGGPAGGGMQLGEAVGKGGYIVVSDTQETIQEIEEEILRIDVPVPQVEIEAYIVEGTLSNDSELGIDWTAVSKDEELEFSFSRDLGGILTKGIITAEKFTGVLNALSSRSRLNVLSNPRITTLEDQPAVFHSGDRIPYSRIIIQDGIEQVDTVFEDVGIVLTATPHVKENGMISLLLATSVSSEGGFTPAGQPRIATRTTQSQVLVKSGDTVVIAGLISDKASMAVSRVPIMGDIPLIGRVFSTEREVKQKSEVTIFITPRIIPQLAMNN